MNNWINKNMNKYNLSFLFMFIIVGATYWSYHLAKINDHEKTQTIRLIDIFLYGPFLIGLALNYNYSNRLITMILLVMGATTIGYNLSNYLSQKIID